MTEFFARLQQKARAIQFHRICRSVTSTPPLRTTPGSLLIASQVCHRDVYAYAVAAKSFYRQIGYGKFLILNDGTLTSEDLAFLSMHLDNPEVISIKDVKTAPCPKGGTWERLLTILDRAANHYVIQLDSDTLTLGDLHEVEQCIDGNRAFTLAGGKSSTFVTLEQAVPATTGSNPLHVQSATEAAFGKFHSADQRKYVRGCSGFAGFPTSVCYRDVALAFSEEARGFLGDRWNQWGTEQITSNYLIANCPDPLLLPYERYHNYQRTPETVCGPFIHFIGTHRFSDSAYVLRTKEMINQLNAC